MGGGSVVQAVMRVMGGPQMKLPSSPAADLLLCGPVPNRLRTATGPQPWGWRRWVVGVEDLRFEPQDGENAMWS